MAQKHIQLYDDSVIKLSIKQGIEADRFHPEVEGVTSTDYNITSTLPGAFTMGELAYTRDTNRVFVGNFTSEKEFLYGSDITSENDTQIIQQTPGGTLVGNKYLGYVDSKPPYNNDDRISTPLSLDKETTFNINGIEKTENGVLTENSKFRSYEFTLSNGDGIYIPTEDHKWNRQSYYNEKYDAYDGDYMYDVYRNALILFDHNIKPSAADATAANTKNPRRPSLITPIETDNKDKSTKTVYNHTLDMYGDGYVCLYNVIPDGDTLTFNAKDFSNTTGIATNGNYTQNIISVQKVYARAMEYGLDSNTFQISSGKNHTEDRIKLQTTQTFERINLPESLDETNKKYLILPNNLGLDGNVCINFDKFNVSTSDTKSYRLKFTYDNTELENYQDCKHLTAEFVDDSILPRYTLNLGLGLESGDGDSKVFFDSDNTSATIKLAGTSLSGDGALTDNPFNLPTTESGALFTSNLVTNVAGNIRSENRYPEAYAEAASKIIAHYDNENTKLNYLVQSTPIVKGVAEEEESSDVIKFKVTPVVYNAHRDEVKSAAGMASGITTVGIHEKNVEISITKTTEILNGYEQTITVNMPPFNMENLQNLWYYCKNGNTENVRPDIYDKGTGALYINHPINGAVSYYEPITPGYSSYIVTEKNDTEKDNVIKSVKFTEGENGLVASLECFVTGENPSEITLDNITKIYSPIDGTIYTSIDQLADIFGVDENNTVVIKEFKTDDLWLNEYYRFEITTDSDKVLINIPVKKYVTEINEVVDEESGLTIYTHNNKKIDRVIFYDAVTTTSSTTYTSRIYDNNNLAEITGLITTDNIFITKKTEGKLVSATCTYMMDVVYANGEKEQYDFITGIPTAGELISTPVETKTQTSDEDDAIEYRYGGSESEIIKVKETYIQTAFIDKGYGVNDEYDITNLFDYTYLYYDKDGKCLSGKSELPGDSNYDPAYNEEKWLEERRIDIMKQFPILPSHVSSVLLECKTETADSTLSLKHVGNGNKNAYGIITDKKFKISNLTLPSSLTNNESETWNKDKELLNITGNTTSYIEVPVSIDIDGNKHFSFKIDYSGSILISLAAYRV